MSHRNKELAKQFPYLWCSKYISEPEEIYVWVCVDGHTEEGFGSTKSYSVLKEWNELARLAIQSKKKVCASCCTLIDIKSNDWIQHFAGFYCKDCKEEYVKNHSRICCLCHQPEWKCSC